jgi:transcription antitermination factor NusG
VSDNYAPWFAVAVKPQHEKVVAAQLQSKALESYLPIYRARHRWSDRVKTVELPLFPRYVFCRFRSDERPKILTTPGVNSIVGFSGKPCPVTDEEIAAVRMMVMSGSPLKVWSCITVGQRVRVRKGAMEGLEGVLVREKADCRLVVNLELLNRGVAVEVERDILEPVPDHPCAHALR